MQAPEYINWFMYDMKIIQFGGVGVFFIYFINIKKIYKTKIKNYLTNKRVNLQL